MLQNDRGVKFYPYIKGVGVEKSVSHAEVSRAEGRRKDTNSFEIVKTRELEVLALGVTSK